MKNRNVKHLRPVIITSFIATAISGCNDVNTNTEYKSIDTTQPRGWELVWSDEFNGSALDSRKWTHEVDCWGGGNNEQQCYSDSSDYSFIQDGMLHLVAKHNGYDDDGNAIAEDGKAYTSARINTKNKGDWKYGRFEMRAKMPAGQGTFPAFWLLPSDSVYGEWPLSGEIDVVETVNLKAGQMRVAEEGETPDKSRWDQQWVRDDSATPNKHLYGTLHYGKAWPNNLQSGQAYKFPDGSNPADGFHTYAIEWQEGEIRWYADGYLYATQRQSETIQNAKGEMLSTLKHTGWYTEFYDRVTGELTGQWNTAPFDQEFHLILNNAVGGDWSENTNEFGVDASAFAEGNAFIIDYVRVYQCKADPETGKGCETVRAGYDQLPSDEPADVEAGVKQAPEYALVEGDAPNPPPPPTKEVAQDLVVFADGTASGWIAWDCCGGSNPAVVADAGDGYGAAVQFDVLNGNAGTVFGFSARSGHSNGDLAGGDTPYDASSVIETATITFDMKVLSMPANAAAVWNFKIESNENSGGDAVQLALVDVDGNAPQAGGWQSYSISMQEIADAGLTPSAIDVLMIFPDWGAGDGASFLVDNMVIDTGVDSGSPQVVLFAEEANPVWPSWDCCGGSTPAVVVDEDVAHGNSLEFEVVNGNSGTVFGFNTRNAADPAVPAPFDATSILTNGVVSFDLKVTSAPNDAAATWQFKVESAGGPDAGGTAVQLALTASAEGAAPVVGQWQTYTYSVQSLVTAGLDASAIDVLMVFPDWGLGDGAVFRMDNVKIYDPTAAAAGTLNIFTDAITENWELFDCCGNVPPVAAVDDDAAHGNVIEFGVGSSATVNGFIADRDNSVAFDASDLLSNGFIRFDMKVTSAPSDGSATWQFKVESAGGPNAGGTEAQLALVSSVEGLAPVVGQWQTYTFTLTDLLNAGLDVSAIDVVMVFPDWGLGEGAVYRIDNMVITSN